MKNRSIIIIIAILSLFLYAGCAIPEPADKVADPESTSIAGHTGRGEKRGVWSPDGKWVAVTISIRNIVDTVILDIAGNKEYDTGLGEYLLEHADEYGLDFNGDENPDITVNFIEWCPNSKKILLSYGFIDHNNLNHSGIAVYSLEKMKVDWISANQPDMQEVTTAVKPEGFSWVAAGYGLKAAFTVEGTSRGDH